jgi:hypothetical protein
MWELLYIWRKPSLARRGRDRVSEIGHVGVNGLRQVVVVSGGRRRVRVRVRTCCSPST